MTQETKDQPKSLIPSRSFWGSLVHSQDGVYPKHHSLDVSAKNSEMLKGDILTAVPLDNTVFHHLCSALGTGGPHQSSQATKGNSVRIWKGEIKLRDGLCVHKNPK